MEQSTDIAIVHEIDIIDHCLVSKVDQVLYQQEVAESRDRLKCQLELVAVVLSQELLQRKGDRQVDRAVDEDHRHQSQLHSEIGGVSD